MVKKCVKWIPLFVAVFITFSITNLRQRQVLCTTTADFGPNMCSGCYVIPFFFSEDWTKSLPLVALQYHEVEIRIKCRSHVDFILTNQKLYASYVFLDTAEREFFANNEHELLITQTQYQPMSKADTSVDLSYFNHPVKAIHIAACATGNFTETVYVPECIFVH